MQVIKTHRILSGKVNAVVAEINRINKKANKLGIGQITFTIGEIYKAATVRFEEIVDSYGKKILVGRDTTAFFNNVTISADVPNSNGWMFAATIVHATDDQGVAHNMIAAFESTTIPTIPSKYRGTANLCEHCNTVRSRYETYVMFNTSTGQFKQVGSSCLQDFLSCDIHNLAMMKGCLDIIRLFNDNDMDEFCGRCSSDGACLEEIIKVAHKYIIGVGYISKKVAQEHDKMSTSMMVDNYFNDNDIPRFKFTDEDTTKAKDVIERFKSLDESEINNDYMHNLKATVCMNFVPWKFLGIAVSLVAWDINRQNRIEADNIKRIENAEKAFMGVMGKMANFTLTCVKKIGPYSQSFNDRNYRSIGFFIMQDINGNIAKVKTDWNWIETGKTYTIRCKPAEYVECDKYEKAKVTVMTLIKNVEEVPAA
jgi:hypothetical protein